MVHYFQVLYFPAIVLCGPSFSGPVNSVPPKATVSEDAQALNVRRMRYVAIFKNTKMPELYFALVQFLLKFLVFPVLTLN